MKRFVAIGECMVEMAPSETPGTFAMGFAGDTLNTAWYARQLLGPDWQVDYVTAVGRDAVSDRMVGFLEAAGIDCTHVQRCEDRTVGLYLIELEGAERHFSYWRGQSAARTLADDPVALGAAMQGAAVVYLSGITLAILSDAARERLLAALRAARASGAQVVFDSNLRPRLWGSDAEMCAWTMRAAGCADIVLPSFDDEARYFGDATPDACAARYAALGVGLVVVKNGAGDMLTLAGSKADVWPVPRVAAPVDTTAAGDSFNAGFLAARLRGCDLKASVLGAAQVAGHVICHRGALIALPETLRQS